MRAVYSNASSRRTQAQSLASFRFSVTAFTRALDRTALVLRKCSDASLKHGSHAFLTRGMIPPRILFQRGAFDELQSVARGDSASDARRC